MTGEGVDGMIWRESLKIGVAEVDQQHEELFMRLNEFLKVVRGADDREVRADKIAETLAFMGEYVIDHFNSEEVLQRKCNYPEYAEHKQIHDKFKAEIAWFQDEFNKDRYNDDLIQEFSGRLLTWLISHVSHDDQKIAEYVK